MDGTYTFKVNVRLKSAPRELVLAISHLRANLGFAVFRIFKLTARFSKCDFWIPGKISDLYGYKKSWKKYFFKIKKKSRTKRKNCFFFN